jgi:hypothetical protein
MPILAERKENVSAHAGCFERKYNKGTGMPLAGASPPALKTFASGDWPTSSVNYFGKFIFLPKFGFAQAGWLTVLS